ncbi:UNVERIFIED_CONTAM: hypothetical protein HHA_214835 [Hammondia hammondi]|eukprot:XP_008886710.1 hypothetical protein HHA_214835 [Hammondia hammondi]
MDETRPGSRGQTTDEAVTRPQLGKRHRAEHPYPGNPQYSTAFDTESVLSVSGSTATSKGRLTTELWLPTRIAHEAVLVATLATHARVRRRSNEEPSPALTGSSRPRKAELPLCGSGSAV